MSIAIINASVGGSLSVAGTTTLSGALTSASTLSCQGIASTALQVNGTNSTFLGIHVNGDTILKGNLICILQKQTTGVNNTILGPEGGASVLSTGSNNVGIGFQTLEQTISGSYDIAVGYQAGGGVLGNECVCIGRNSGITPSNSYNQSVCIGINSQITASNQISLGTANETIQILGPLSTGSSTITNTQLGYVSGLTSNLQTQLDSATTQRGAIAASVTSLQTTTTNIQSQNVATTANVTLLQTKTTAIGYNLSTTTIIGNTNILGRSIYLNDNAIYLRADTNHSLRYNITVDGPVLQGFSGGKLATSSNSNVLKWSNQLVNINLPLEMIQDTGSIRMNGSTFYYGPTGDSTDFLQYNGTTAGVSLQSSVGGKIGTTSKNDMINWNSTSGVNTTALNGNVSIPSTNEIRLNGAPIYLKSVGDNNHVLRYNGGSFDGPLLQGTTGGILATATNSAVLSWSNTSVNMNLPIICNSSIQQSQSGYCVNFYRKTSCGTSETYDFQSAHGKYDVFFNANHDRNTTAYFHVDILNNVNNGSFVVQVYKGVSVTIAIDVNTNILTMNCAVSGGTLQINRIMSYY